MDRGMWEAGIVLDSCKALLLNCTNDDAVLDQRSRTIMVVTGNTQYGSHRINLCSEQCVDKGRHSRTFRQYQKPTQQNGDNHDG